MIQHRLMRSATSLDILLGSGGQALREQVELMAKATRRRAEEEGRLAEPSK
jgi:hypothetical protein